MAEETGVDAEEEPQAESPQRLQVTAGTSAGRQNAEEPETGMFNHTLANTFFVILLLVPTSMLSTECLPFGLQTVCLFS